MKVILKADVKGSGKKGDIIEVSDGFAQNFLLKKGLAEIATASGINEITQRKAADQFHKAEELKAMKELAAALNGLIANGIVARKSSDAIPPRVEYSLTEKGASVVPILQSICQWTGVFYKDAGETPMIQCQKCDHR